MISSPFLLLDSGRCKQNITRMAGKAQSSNLIFRPHFKTHQSHAVGRWFREAGVSRITVSSAEMARYFARDGWKDITIAFPLSRFHVEAVNRLAEDIQLNITFSSIQNLLDALPLITGNVGVFIEVDVGNNRSGVHVSNTRELALMVNQVAENPKLTFCGFITHAGQSYHVTGEKNVMAIHNQAMGELVKLKSFWSQQFPNIIISYGDTPTCSLADDFWGVNEIRPGNFVFYDVMQYLIGSCSLDDIALALICPVVDVYP
ncbi:MAG: alanine racemase, partial [Tenuifilaceae bacterium]